MGKATGFMEYKREKGQEKAPLERISSWKEYASRLSDDKLQTQGARCMDCGTPFCHMGIEIRGTAAGCPINNVIPEWNDLVYKGKWKEALDRLHMTNNFPEFTGRVCPAPCEGSCTLAITDPAVAIKSIERTIIDKGFENGWVTPRIPETRSGYKVAIVGSGPAGLAAADQLNQLGHNVTVFERSDRFGGLLMYGIPNMKLEKEIIERRIHLLALEGIRFVNNTEIGKDVTKEQLQTEYDAVILCTGAQKQRLLHMEGSDAGNIHLAMDYLTGVTKSLLDSNFKDKKALNVEGKDVIVIGGSDTDAALHYLARMLEGFGDLKSINRRLSVIAFEDISLADPSVFSAVMAAIDCSERVGMPEARIPLANAVILLCLSPKSNSAYKALDIAIADVRSGNIGDIPKHLKDSHYASASKLGNGVGYKYPHDYKGGWVNQSYLPEALEGTRYYEPKEVGKEKQYAGLYHKLQELKEKK